MDGHTDVLYDAAQATYRACCTRRLSQEGGNECEAENGKVI